MRICQCKECKKLALKRAHSIDCWQSTYSKLNSTKLLDQNKNIPNKHMVDPASCMNTKTNVSDMAQGSTPEKSLKETVPSSTWWATSWMYSIVHVMWVYFNVISSKPKQYLYNSLWLVPNRQVPDGTRKIQGCLLCLFTMRFLEGMAFKEGRSRLHLASGKSRVPWDYSVCL